ncbi:cofilin-2 [Latimeria chalumnae]|uniref:ADF-H domain-containing protein n=1 Tax=Latimeria chalumnae TaxID=7897 RepID=M3XHU6_LATCH|nr:PREDICTED: cofilin-2-like [Latimeria chalumnae]|eukprot:XP_005998154.1 PREDICTED: cofilin-2-like [Latimeria chalumnae]
MASSGVGVHDECITVFNTMKVRKSGTKGGSRNKLVFFCLNPDKTQIIVDSERILTVDPSDACPVDAYQKLLDMLPENECRYALYDASFETNETKKEDLVFIYWCPDTANIKDKMVYSSSKNALKEKLVGIKHSWEVNSFDDCKDRECLASRLGAVKSLEGKAVLQSQRKM